MLPFGVDMVYKVELDIYCGPLDLLLYLIQQEEVDIYDIPISRILERYIEHLEHVKHLDINLAAEFLVMASQLMEIKSKMLLPPEDRAPEEEGEEDPRAQLVRQLLAYRTFKEAATRLGEYREARARRYGRGRPVRLSPESERAEGASPAEDLKDVSLFDLASGYEKLMKATGGSRTATIVYDEISMEARIDAIIAALRSRDEFALKALLSETASRIEIVGTFFALLELVKEHKVRVYQDSDFGEIIVRRREDIEDAEEPGPAGPCVEPHLPAPRTTVEGKDGRKISTAPRRSHFGGLDLPEDQIEAELPEDVSEGAAEDGESGDTDEREHRLNRRIDEILRRADEISARFERSRAGRHREGTGASVSAGLDDAMAAFEGDLGAEGEETGAADATGGGDPAHSGGASTDAPPENNGTENRPIA
jgi:segregation and condensation protein A